MSCFTGETELSKLHRQNNRRLACDILRIGELGSRSCLMANQCVPFTREADLDSIPNPDTDSDVSKIAAVWEVWNAAREANDASRLATFVTDDVVFVHGNGRCVCGKEELKADFLNSFERFDFDRRYLPAETVVRGQ